MTSCRVCSTEFLPLRPMAQVAKRKRKSPPPKHDLTGQVFKDLRILSRAEPRAEKARWIGLCRCGAESTVYQTHLLRGMTGTCNHGLSNTPEFSSWTAMRARVSNSNHEAFHRYGGRGIKICERWSSFLNFLEDMGPRPEGRSLDRFPDKHGDYEPGNCRWATSLEQQNNLSNNRLVEHEGQLLTVAQLARKFGVCYATMHSRLSRGKGPEL